MLIRVVIALCSVFWVCSVPASLLNRPEQPAHYMQTTENAAIWGQVGDTVIRVGTVRAGVILGVVPESKDYYAFRFGFGRGFIDAGHLSAVPGDSRVSDSLGDLSKPLSNQNLLTLHDVTLYSEPDKTSQIIGILAENLRYPVIAELKDRLNQSWFQIRIANRLAWVSSLDAQQDHGIAVLTYHHILRDEENIHFRHTTTTTSLRAFTSQMAWLKAHGYTTLTMYELEGYVRNRLNLPAKAVVITFDDGLKSVYRYAYPVLKREKFRATAFIISSRIKRYPQPWNPHSLQFMSVPELEVMHDVFDIQSHTHFLHRTDAPWHPVLLSRSYHNILMDFERSRRALAQFNPHVLYLSYPFGGYNLQAIRAAEAAGFHMAVTTVKGKVKPGDNPYLLKRLYVLKTDSVQTLSRLVGNQPQ